MKSTFQLLLVMGFILFVFSSNAQADIFGKEIRLDRSALLDETFIHYNIYEVDLPLFYQLVHDEQKMESGISFALGNNHDWELHLIPHDVRSDNYLLRINTPSGVITQPKGENITYSGYVTKGNEVSLTVNRNFLYGYIHTKGHKYFLEPANKFISELPENYIVIYKDTEVRPGSPMTCGATELRPTETEAFLTPRANQCYIVEVALATDFELFSAPGYGSVASVQNRNIAVFNNVATYYRHEFDDNIEMQIVEQWIASSNPDPWTNSTDAGTLLNSFTNWGNGGGFTNGYDIAQLISGRNLNGNTVGLAWVGAVCTTARYSIVQDLTTSWGKTVDSSHEIGHNFNASHDASGSPYIMAPAINNTSTWSAVSKSDISAHIASRGCLSNCTGTPIANFTADAVAVCPGNIVTFKDKSTNGSTRNWSFPGGAPNSSTIQQPQITYNVAGTYNVSITSSGNGGNNSLTRNNYISVQNPTAATCAPSGAGGAGGLSFFSLANISNASGTSQRYSDFICSKSTELQPSTHYDLSVTVGSSGNAENIRFYIDYNNDGDFTDAGENIANSNFLWIGGPVSSVNDAGLQFTTPAAPPVEGVLLRMRVIAKNNVPNNPCVNPTTGEVEDYGIIFPGVLPVQLIDFSGRQAKGQIELFWETAIEVNSDLFEIERSINGRDFEKIGSIRAGGNLDAGQKYNFIDKSPFSGTNYYRLRQIDYDQTARYSSIVAMLMDKETKVNIYPNPAKDFITIQAKENVQTLSVEVFDQWGQRIKENETAKNLLSLDGIVPGFYMLKIKTTDGIIFKKLIVE